MKRIIFYFKKYEILIVLVALCLIYLSLAYKNPFSDNSLISNLEPYPDTLLYSFPAWNWVRGNGWNLGVKEKIVPISVPNTYGFYLVPFFKIFNDIRAFYYANMLLAFGTIIFFVLALKNIVQKNRVLIIGYVGFLLVTNFYFFNQPQLVMTEMVNYFLVSLFLFLISLKFKWKHLLPIVMLVVVTLSLKVSNMVLGGAFALSFFIKIFLEKLRFLKNKKVLYFLGLFSLLAFIIFYLPKLLSLSSYAFNLKYFLANFNFYYSCLSGGECRNLWYWQKMFSWEIFFLFISGVIFVLVSKKKKETILISLIPFVLLIAAMSLFIDTEGRHVEFLILNMLFVLASFINTLFYNKKNVLIIVVCLLLVNILLTSYSLDRKEIKIISLKKQVGLNFRHREDPWNYLCLKMVENFMMDKKDDYFASFLPLYFFDAYNVNFNYLPLAQNQDFMLDGRGLQKHYPLPIKNIFEEILAGGKTIYLSDYYSSNGREAWRQEWNILVKNKKIEKVFQSPLDNCNIYKLEVEK